MVLLRQASLDSSEILHLQYYSTEESDIWIWGEMRTYSFKGNLESMYCPTMLISEKEKLQLLRKHLIHFP